MAKQIKIKIKFMIQKRLTQIVQYTFDVMLFLVLFYVKARIFFNFHLLSYM